MQPRTRMADFLLGVRVGDDEGVFDAPVGGIGDVRDAGQAVEAMLSLARMCLPRIFSAPCGAGRPVGRKWRSKRLRGARPGALTSRASGLARFRRGAFRSRQAVAQGIDQRIAALPLSSRSSSRWGLRCTTQMSPNTS